MAMRLRKGEMEAWEMVGVILILIALLFGAMFIVTGGKGIKAMLDELCRLVGLSCGEVGEEDRIATQSFNALSCSVNTISTGQLYEANECQSLYVTAEAAEEAQGKQTSDKPDVSKDLICEDLICCKVTGFVNPEWLSEGECSKKSAILASGVLDDKECESKIGPKPATRCRPVGKAVVDCRDGTRQETVCSECSILNDDGKIMTTFKMPPMTIESEDILEDANKKCFDEAKKRMADIEESKVFAKGCKKEDVIKSCRVQNFNLPDDLADLPDYKALISGFGNPTYLTYYQHFPEGEDSAWKAYGPWWQNFAEAALYAVPFGPAFRLGGKVIKGAVVTPIKTIAQKGATGTVKELPGAAKRAYEGLKGTLMNVPNRITEDKVLLVGIRKGSGSEFGKLGEYSRKSEILTRLYYNRISQQVIKMFDNPSDFAKRVDLEKAKQVFGDSLTKRVTPKGVETITDEKQLRQQLEVLLNDYVKWNKRKEGQSLAEILDLEPFDLYNVLDKEGQDMVAKEVFKDVGWETGKRTMKMAGYVSLAAFIASQFECETLKSTPVPESMLLMKALRCTPGNLTQPIDVVDASYDDGGVELGKPVILDKGYASAIHLGGPVIGTLPTPFYLASPCLADLTVESKQIKCFSYTYDAIEGVTRCDLPDLGPIKDQLSCAELRADKRFEEHIKAFLKDRNEDRKRLFSYSGGSLQRISFPNFEEFGAKKEDGVLLPLSVRNIEKLPGCAPYERTGDSGGNPLIIGLGESYHFSCYTADVYLGDDKIDRIDPADEKKRAGEIVDEDANYFICGDKDSYSGSGKGPSSRPIDKFYKPPYGEESYLNLNNVGSHCFVKSRKFSDTIDRKTVIFLSSAGRDKITDGGPENIAYKLAFTLTKATKFNPMPGRIEFSDDYPLEEKDGIMDTIIVSGDYIFKLSDRDNDAKIDWIQQTYPEKWIRFPGTNACTVDATVISVDKKDAKGKKNFCYGSNDANMQAVAIAAQSAAIFADAAVGTATGGLATPLIVGVTQFAIGYFTAEYTEHKWPE